MPHEKWILEKLLQLVIERWPDWLSYQILIKQLAPSRIMLLIEKPWLLKPFLQIFSFRTAECPKLHDNSTLSNQRWGREGKNNRRGKKGRKEREGGGKLRHLHAGQFSSINTKYMKDTLLLIVSREPSIRFLFCFFFFFLQFRNGILISIQKWCMKNVLFDLGWNSSGETLMIVQVIVIF